MGSYKERIDQDLPGKAGRPRQVEVACNEPVGEDIRKGLTEELGKLDGVIVVDEAPDWVYSIIASHYSQLVELSVVLRQFFRASKPGTEQDTSTPSGGKTLKSGAWVYEWLKFMDFLECRLPTLRGYWRR